MSKSISTLVLNHAEIELYKALKAEGLTSSGAEAKLVIADGLVKVNGKTEIRKRKKIIEGDIITFDGNTIRVTK